MLKIEDRLAIDDLYARYNHYIDFDRFDEWTALFTEDGVFQASGMHKGHTELGKFVRERAMRDTPYIHGHHWNANLLLEPDGDLVQASCYLLRVAVHKETGEKQIATMGRYVDVLVKTDKGWRFKRRQAITL